MITQIINDKIRDAMKAHDELRLSTLKLLLSALNYEKIAKQHELTEEEEIAVVRKEAKKRMDAIEAYKKAGAADRAEKENQELLILKEYLPPDMPPEELETIVDETVTQLNAQSMVDMGKVIGMVMSKIGGRADGKVVAEMVKKRLT